MRRVLKHHVCFCFLSTALLAGVSLIAAQEKVYAGSQGNCKGAVDTGSDGEQPIVCGGTSDGVGGGVVLSVSDGVLKSDRTIDMGNYIGMPAVKVYGDADITMSGTLRVTGSSDNDSPAIKVHGGGGLKLVEATIVDVSKGIEADGGFVTVVAGSIGVKNGGDAVIEVKNKGKVTLMMKGQGVRGGGSNSTGIVMDGDGTVVLDGTNFTQVTTGIMIKGNGGKASVNMTGKGTTITVGSNGKGIVMQGQGEASATVMGGTIEGGGGVVGAEVKGGTLTLIGTNFTKVTTGAEVSGGKLEMTKGKIEVTSANGTGLSVSGQGKASATVTNVKIVGKGDGSGDKGTGVVMMGDGEVTLMGTTVESFLTGVSVSDGTVKINGESTIKAKGTHGVGIKVEGGTLKIEGSSTIEAKGTHGVGIRVEEKGSASVTVMGGKIVGNESGSGQGIGVDMAGEGTVELTKVTVSGFETGVEVKSGTVTIEGSSTKIAATGTGLSVQGGTVTMMGGTISEGGVYMSGGTLTLEDVTVSGSSTGVTMSGGTFKMIRGSIKGSETGTGVDISGKGEVTLEEVDISKVTMGVTMSGGKSLTMKDGMIKEFTTAGVNVEEGAVVVNVDGTKIMGNGTSRNGVYVGSSVTGAVTLKDVTVSEVATGVYVKSGATKAELTLTGGSIGFTRMGVMVQDGEAKLMKTVITGSGGGNGGTGVYATGGEVTLEDVEISKVATGVDISGGKSLTMKDGMIKEFTTAGVSVGISVTRAELTGTRITGKGSGTGVKVEDRATASLTLTDVKISKVATGVEMLAGKNLTISGGTIKGVMTGIDMSGSGALMISGSSTIEFTSDNGYGVYVGGEVTKADLTNVTVTGKDNKGVGVYAMGGRTMVMTLTDVKISEVTTGLYMMGKGELTVSGNSTTINFAGGYGVYVGDKVKSATNEDGD
ncbi:copper-binding protein (NosD) [Bartonella sp. WD12.1]|nr:copper-binding protein (NosD) [Bartonella sp. WD12.1]